MIVKDTSRFDNVFSDLVAVWSRHQQLKASGASVAELFDSRRQLDSTRLAVARARAHRHRRPFVA